MKKFIVINGTEITYIEEETLKDAVTYCQNYCNHSEEVIVREYTRQSGYLTDLEYGVVMQAIENAKDLHADGDFVDPYAENEEGYTDEDVMKALESAEDKIQRA